jgi:hypothetical protein
LSYGQTGHCQQTLGVNGTGHSPIHCLQYKHQYFCTTLLYKKKRLLKWYIKILKPGSAVAFHNRSRLTACVVREKIEFEQKHGGLAQPRLLALGKGVSFH